MKFALFLAVLATAIFAEEYDCKDEAYWTNVPSRLYRAICKGEYDQRIDNFPEMKGHYLRAIIFRDKESTYNVGWFYHQKLKDYPKAIEWYEQAFRLGSLDACYNLGQLYKDQLRNINKSIEWHKKCYEAGEIESSPRTIGISYEALKDYDDSIKWYQIAYDHGDISAAVNMGVLYYYTLKTDADKQKGLDWLLKAASAGHENGIRNVAAVYYEQGDRIRAAAYWISLINFDPKDKVIKFLKSQGYADQELKKAYELQLKLDIPKHYTGGID